MSCDAPNRIYAQYRNRPKFTAWMGVTHQIGGELCDAAEVVQQSYNIDINVGEQLDNIGRIVVVDRTAFHGIELEVYECDNEDVECGNDTAQCSQTSIDEDAALSDEYFRTLIKSKIEKNNSDATIEGMLDAVSMILGSSDSLRVIDGEDMTFSIEYHGPITSVERTLIYTKDVIPRPQGVQFRGFFEYHYITECDNDELMCGDELAQCAGPIEV